MAQLWPYWFRDVLAGLDAPDTAHNELFLNVWQTYEQSGAQNNPLNTTQPWPGSSIFNSAGVRNYATTTDGANATVATIKNGRYDATVAALRTGDPFTVADTQAVADAITTWGTPNFADWYLKQGPTAQTGPLSAAPFPNAVGAAWMRLMRTLAVTAPRSLRAQAKARARLNRAVR